MRAALLKVAATPQAPSHCASGRCPWPSYAIQIYSENCLNWDANRPNYILNHASQLFLSIYALEHASLQSCHVVAICSDGIAGNV